MACLKLLAHGFMWGPDGLALRSQLWQISMPNMYINLILVQSYNCITASIVSSRQIEANYAAQYTT